MSIFAKAIYASGNTAVTGWDLTSMRSHYMRHRIAHAESSADLGGYRLCAGNSAFRLLGLAPRGWNKCSLT
jgi:hypothetical protein